MLNALFSCIWIQSSDNNQHRQGTSSVGRNIVLSAILPGGFHPKTTLNALSNIVLGHDCRKGWSSSFRVDCLSKPCIPSATGPIGSHLTLTLHIGRHGDSELEVFPSFHSFALRKSGSFAVVTETANWESVGRRLVDHDLASSRRHVYPRL